MQNQIGKSAPERGHVTAHGDEDGERHARPHLGDKLVSGSRLRNPRG